MVQEPVIPSAVLTVATTAVVAAPALLHSIILNAATAESTITLYDNKSAASGTVLAKLQAAAGTATGPSGILQLSSPIMCLNGITAVVTGSGATAMVYFQRAN